jgi:hypothetical protein
LLFELKSLCDRVDLFGKNVFEILVL